MIGELSQHHPALALVVTTALVLVVGVVAQILAARLRIPAILPLLALGIVLGPEGLGLIQPELYGVGLRAIVSVAVAIIVFEGAMMIDARQLKHSSRSVLGLITTGALTTFVLAGTAAHLVVGFPWKVALLFGAIVSVTGPTVINPILKRLPLSHRLKTTLEAESVLVDAIGVLLTAAVFSYITASNLGVVGGMLQLLTNLSTGAAVGAAAILLLAFFLRWATSLPSELVRMTVLGTALLAYASAEVLAPESGIAAVAVAGLLVGSMQLPYEQTIKQFKGDLVLIALCLVFILLAAGMRVDQVVALGWEGLVLVLLLMAVIRPAAVGLATWGTALSWREKAFIAWMGPRGIVAASMASLMTIELKAWDIQGSEGLGPLVFLTVLVTVLVEGSGAGWVASRLKVMPKRIVVVGGDEVARKLAHQLVEEGEAVTLLDRDPASVQAALQAGLMAVQGDATDPGVLAEAGLGWCKALVAATQSDKSNLLIGQAVKSRYPDLRLIARISDSKNKEAFQDAGFETLVATDAMAMTLSALVSRPTVLPLLQASAYGDALVEIEIGNPRVVDVPLGKLALPHECLVALIKRQGQVSVPDGKSCLQLGDRATLIGLKEAVSQARTLLESDV